MPRIAAIEKRLEERERRQFRAAVIFGVAVAALVLAVGFNIWQDFEQDDQIRAVSACYSKPKSPECIRGHAVSVSHTTHAEACFILAKGGYRCRKALPETAVLRERLISGDAVPGSSGKSISFNATAPPDSSPVTQTPDDPPSANPAPSTPTPTPTPTPEPPTPNPPTSTPPAPQPPPPAAPKPTRPLVDLPDQLGVCVNALGLRVAC